MVQQLPHDVLARLRALGQDLPEIGGPSFALVMPFHDKLGYTAPEIVRDLKYGDHERHRLDVHTAERGERSADLAPVFMFVHGGGFGGGDKYSPDTPEWDLVGAWAVRHGWVGVNITYRYAPEFKWPSGAQDVGAAVAWLREHIARYGGDPDRIVIAGHSAGAVHVADFVAGRGGGSLAGVRGAVMASGTYGPRAVRPVANPHPYYPDPDDPAIASLPGLLESPVPLLFAVGENDPDRWHMAVTEVATALQERHGTLPDIVWVDGHNHVSIIWSLGVDEPALGVPLARFVEHHTSK